MTWPSHQKKIGLRGGWCKHAVMGKFGYRPGWYELALMSILAEGRGDRNDLPWMHKALAGWLDSYGV